MAFCILHGTQVKQFSACLDILACASTNDVCGSVRLVVLEKLDRILDSAISINRTSPLFPNLLECLAVCRVFGALQTSGEVVAHDFPVLFHLQNFFGKLGCCGLSQLARIQRLSLTGGSSGILLDMLM